MPVTVNYNEVAKDLLNSGLKFIHAAVSDYSYKDALNEIYHYEDINTIWLNDNNQFELYKNGFTWKYVIPVNPYTLKPCTTKEDYFLNE